MHLVIWLFASSPKLLPIGSGGTFTYVHGLDLRCRPCIDASSVLHILILMLFSGITYTNCEKCSHIQLHLSQLPKLAEFRIQYELKGFITLCHGSSSSHNPYASSQQMLNGRKHQALFLEKISCTAWRFCNQ